MNDDLLRFARRSALLVVGAVVLLFALIGALHTFRGTPVSRVEVVGGGTERPAITDSLFRETVELLTGTPLRHGHQVELLLNGDETFPRLWRELRGARRSITLQLYYMLPGAVSDSLFTVLAERSRAGVQVYLLHDAIGSDIEPVAARALRAAGVRMAAYRPVRWYTLNRAQHRSHVRAVVIDGQVGYTGGFGVDDKWLGDGVRGWRETNVRFRGPAVGQLQAAFAIGWAEATGQLLTGPLFFPPAAFQTAGPRTAGLLYASPTVGSTKAERFLALSIAGARRTLYIANAYFVPDDDLRRLLRQAVRRGVDVRVLTAGRHTDIPSVRLAARDRYEELLRAGVRIYEYAPTMLHAKTLVADGVWSTVGTMNFDNRSAALNEESNLVVLDAQIGERLQRIFLADLRQAREIRLAQFRRRSAWQRLLENAASLLTRVL